MLRHWKLALAILIPALLWMLPTASLHGFLPGLTIVEHRLLAIFAIAVVAWTLEPVPIFATSVFVTVAAILTISDGGIAPLIADGLARQPVEGFGRLLRFQDLMASFAAPEIMLFLGGFFLAEAATKYRLDLNIARVLVKPFGRDPKFVMLGLMVVTAVFSMFMSNTACTAMMLAVLGPVLKGLPAGDRARTAFVLAIPVAANIGGIGTPIGTPPNAVAMKYLTGGDGIGFAEWMAFGVPFVIVLLAIGWAIVLMMFRPQVKTMELTIEGRFQRGAQAITVYITFALTILLWVTESWHGMKSSVVAMIPIAVFLVGGALTAKDLRNMSWDVLWLIAGGFALGLAMEKTGLSNRIVASIPFAEMPALVILGVATLVTLLMATFMSNTATANLLLPIMATLGAALPAESLGPVGGAKGLILAVTITASMGMALPVSTPPNALAHATGMVTTAQMARSSGLIALIGTVLTWVLLAVLKAVGTI